MLPAQPSASSRTQCTQLGCGCCYRRSAGSSCCRGTGSSHKKGATHPGGSTAQIQPPQLPKPDHPAGKCFGDVYLPGGYSQNLLPENLARMYHQLFMYSAKVNRENYKAWVKTS